MNERTMVREIAERMFADGMSYSDILSVFREAVENASDNHEKIVAMSLEAEGKL